MHTHMSWCPADTPMPRSDLICSCHRVAAPEEARRALVSLHPSEPSPGGNGNTRTHHWLGQRMTTAKFLIQALMSWCTKCHPRYSNECKHVFDLKIMNGLSDFLLLRQAHARMKDQGKRSVQFSLEQSDESIHATGLCKHTLLPCITVLKHSWRPESEMVKETLRLLSTQINEAIEGVA